MSEQEVCVNSSATDPHPAAVQSRSTENTVCCRNWEEGRSVLLSTHPGGFLALTHTLRSVRRNIEDVDVAPFVRAFSPSACMSHFNGNGNYSSTVTQLL